MTRKSFIALLLTVSAMMLVSIAPANASVTGGLVLTCTASLPTFPQPSETSVSAGCPGTAVGVLAGLDNASGAYVIAGPVATNADFNYSEGCATAGLIGEAEGKVYSTGPATAVHNGALTTASISVPFVWTRIGTAAIILTGNLAGQPSPNDHKAITFGNGGAAADVLGGAAAAAFIPEDFGVANTTCPGTKGLTALVAGLDIEVV